MGVRKDEFWVLKKAAQVLDNEGWHQGNVTEVNENNENSLNGSYELVHPGMKCARSLVGAVEVICRRFNVKVHRRYAAYNLLYRGLNVTDLADGLNGWNDNVLRTKEEVTGALRSLSIPPSELCTEPQKSVKGITSLNTIT